MINVGNYELRVTTEIQKEKIFQQRRKWLNLMFKYKLIFSFL